LLIHYRFYKSVKLGFIGDAMRETFL
jgi:hypothetical protein